VSSIVNAERAGGDKVGDCLEESALNREALTTAGCNVSVHEIEKFSFRRQAASNELVVYRILVL
jgi:hypothetical protein